MTSDIATLTELLTDLIGAPSRDHARGFSRWCCPVCAGGYGDPIYRPLVISDDGRIWCESQFDRSWARACCNFTLKRLVAALQCLQADRLLFI